MVKINRVYTGGGDGGESSLVDGSRRTKSDARFNVVGTCDEANSWLGMILAEVHRLPDHDDGGERTNVQRVQTVLTEALSRVQNELFDLGAELACPPATLPDYMVLISEGQTDVLMEEMDAWLETLPELKSFILPAGSPTVACMHVARTVVRRLERTIVHLMDQFPSSNTYPKLSSINISMSSSDTSSSSLLKNRSKGAGLIVVQPPSSTSRPRSTGKSVSIPHGAWKLKLSWATWLWPP